MTTSAESCLRDLLLRSEALYGDEPAVLFQGVEWSWRQLTSRVHRLADALGRDGVARGSRVAVVQQNRPEFVELGFALAELGAVFVPISHRAARPEVDFILQDAGVKKVFVSSEHADKLAGSGLPHLVTGTEEYEAYVAAGSDSEPALVESANDPVLQIYTSGTTGRPKGVVLSQRAMVQHGYTVLISQCLRHEDVFLSVTPLSHAAAATRIFSLAIDGIAHAILERFDVGEFFEAVQKHRVTTTIMVPQMLRSVVESSELPNADLSTLRLLVYGAGATPPALLRTAMERISCGFLTAYGLSEGCPALTALSPDEHRQFLDDEERSPRLGSIGRPIPGVRVKIVDGDGREVPRGEAGELLVRSTKQMLGYYEQPDASEEAFQGGWLHTGDIAFVDEEGYVFLVDRKKDMLKSGGINVYPSEIERVFRLHPAVLDVAVVGQPDEKWGEVPVAFIQLHAKGESSEDELRTFCREHLAGYKVPRQVVFVEALPRNATEKVMKHLLVEHFGTPSP